MDFFILRVIVSAQEGSPGCPRNLPYHLCRVAGTLRAWGSGGQSEQGADVSRGTIKPFRDTNQPTCLWTGEEYPQETLKHKGDYANCIVETGFKLLSLKLQGKHAYHLTT